VTVLEFIHKKSEFTTNQRASLIVSSYKVGITFIFNFFFDYYYYFCSNFLSVASAGIRQSVSCIFEHCKVLHNRVKEFEIEKKKKSENNNNNNSNNNESNAEKKLDTVTEKNIDKKEREKTKKSSSHSSTSSPTREIRDSAKSNKTINISEEEQLETYKISKVDCGIILTVCSFTLL
jgi:hypothetical protein